MFEQIRRRVARMLWPKGGQVRMYSSARASRLSGGNIANSSADMELVTSLTNLRGQSRKLVRDASYAKNGKRIVQNNVIGTGVGLQSNVMTTRGEVNTPVNDAIEEAFKEWCCADHCHTGGALHFHDMERMLIGQVFEAGEIFVRLHYTPFGQSRVPLALEVIEPERIADETDPGPTEPGNTVRMGIEVDKFYRPVAYWIRERHQGEFRLGVQRSDRFERVPAAQIFHLRIVERWPQTRGEPWLHTVVRKLQDIDGYSEAEIVAARGASNYFASIKLGDDPHAPVGETQPDGSIEMALEPGTIKKLAQGEELIFHTPNRPNAAMDPFMRLMLREVAAGIGSSYESLSRDYSQSNYSSSRLALLDDRDLWRFVQLWYIRNFRMPLHQIWLQQAILARAVSKVGLEAYATDVQRYCVARYKPRGWSWIDPTKEVEAFAKAVRNGFTDVGHVISQTADGRDLEDVIDARSRELDLMKKAGLEFDTDPARAADGKAKDQPKPEQSAAQKPPASAPADGEPKDGEAERAVRACLGGMADVERARKAPQTIVSLPAINVAQPNITVQAGDVRVEPQSITVNTPAVTVEPSRAAVHVDAPNVSVAAPNVSVAAADVRIENKVETPSVHVEAPQVRVENHVGVPSVRVEAPNVTVEQPVITVAAPEVRIEVAAPNVSVAAPEVKIDNRIDVAHETETVTEHKRDERGELQESRARTRIVR